MKHRHDGGQTGATLLELLTVVAVVGIGAAMATPGLFGVLERTRTRQEIQALEDEIREARALARAEMRPATVTIEEGDLVIRVEGGETRTYALGDRILQTTFDDGVAALVFNANGGVDARDPVRLRAETRRGDRFTFVVYPAIGMVRLE